MIRDRSERELTLSFAPGIRRIYVDRRSIVAPSDPSRHRADNVRYRVSTAGVLVSIVAGIVAFGLLSLAVGAFAVILLLIYLAAVLRIEWKRTEALIDELMRRLPRETVEDMVKRGYSECRGSSSEYVTLTVGGTRLTVLCGHPRVCVEYHRGRVAAFALSMLAVCISMIVAYCCIPYLFLFSLAGAAAVLAVFWRYPLCKRMGVRR